MTPSQLKYAVESANPNSKFFTRANMQFSGDTMANYGCRDAGDCWELYRKRPVKHGLQRSAFFDKVDFRQRWPELATA
jgi:hypothetical protein